MADTPEAVARFFADTPLVLRDGADDAFGGGNFGHWMTDEDGLPAYEYTMDQVNDPRAEYETTRGPSRDHWHLVGNDRVIATAHNEGYVHFYDWTRGGKSLNRWDPGRNRFGGGFKFIEADGAVWNTLWSYLPEGAAQRRVFGVGYFEKQTRYAGLAITERVAAPPGDDPVLVSETKIQNTSAVPKELTVTEFWDVDLLQITVAPLVMGPFLWIRDWLNLLFTITPAWDASTGTLQANFRFVLPFLSKDKEASALCDFHPKTAFLAALDSLPEAYVNYAVDAGLFFGKTGISDPPGVKGNADGKVATTRLVYSGNTILAFRRRVRLAPNEETVLHYLYGYDEASSIPGLVQKYKHEPVPKARATVEFAGSEAPWLTRELAWHAYNLQAGSIYSDFYRAHIVDQGSAYAYEQGLSGATRDFALFTLPLVYLRPDLAKESLRFMMRTQDPQSGAFQYALMGNGIKGGLILHSKSSDLELFFLWALSEYLGATRDLDFLNEPEAYYPPSKQVMRSVLEHARAAFRHLERDIGLGCHGVIHCGTGDWNDGLLALSNHPLATFFRGESAQDAGLATFVLPGLAEAVQGADHAFAEELCRFAMSQSRALAPLWNGRWMARGYSGCGNDFLGGDRLFLDAQPFGVLGNVWTWAQLGAMFGSISSLCVQPQRAGALCIAPIENAIADPGTTWAAVDSWTVHAWAKMDPSAAWDFFLRTTLAVRAEAYPDLWYGIWSGPDAYNADQGNSPGAAFTGVLTPTCNFPVMNMNRHAGVLYDAIKLAGIESRNGQIVIDPRWPLEWSVVRLPLLGIAYMPTLHRGYYNPVVIGTFRFAVRIPVQLDPAHASVFSKGNNVSASVTSDGFLLFELDGQPGQRLEWEIR